MWDRDVFVFGSKIFPSERKRDAVSHLPLELSWKIFTLLDDTALRNATRVSRIWKSIITSNKKLVKRLNIFELACTLGSRRLAKYYRKNERKLKKMKKNYLPTSEALDEPNKPTSKLKRVGELLKIKTKRFKLF